MVAKYFSCTFLLFKNATNLQLLGIMHAAPPLAKSPLLSSYSRKNVCQNFRSLLHKLIYNSFLLLMDGGCILSICPCQPLHAVGYPFD